MTKDYEGALDYFQQALAVQEMVFGKAHPDTLQSIMNMAVVIQDGLKDFTKAEGMFRHALDGLEKSLGKNHEDTRNCADNLAVLYVDHLKDKWKAIMLAKEFPHLFEEGGRVHLKLPSVPGKPDGWNPFLHRPGRLMSGVWIET